MGKTKTDDSKATKGLVVVSWSQNLGKEKRARIAS